ncbi:spermatogenesis-associated protein 7 homolog isoform X2 [Pleurodeles waltl]|uniref:spermatogenesis-associated protein 7 homolog isoform X2 n=1 Tax=Pleurodeles waltl TaxID=8319 RepID=UPI0037093C67
MSKNMLASKGTQSAMIPKYSMMGPFKGHMSMKSSPLYPGSSCKLSTQYLIQDHMAAHYRKLLTSKAAVDSSAPSTLRTSIKYKDQKKKEQLIAAVEQFKKEIQRIRSASTLLPRSDSPKTHKLSLDEQDSLFLTQTRTALPVIQSEDNVPVRSTHSRSPSPVSIAQDTVRGIIQHTISSSPHYQRSHPLVTSKSLYIQSMKHADSLRTKKPFQDPQMKTYSGDLLEKHSNMFSVAKKPFTPRTLKKSAKSFLSKYKYYTPPKKNGPAAFLSSTANEEYHESPTETYRSLLDMYLKVDANREPSYGDKEDNHMLKSQEHNNQRSQILAKEDELRYLQFLREVTEDILMRGNCSAKILGNVFQAQLETRRHDLDEFDALGLDVLHLLKLSPMIILNHLQEEAGRQAK